MSNWVPRTNRSGLEYGGASHDFFWNPAYNPNATYGNCMANCTTYAYGRILEAGDPAPVRAIVDAANWPSYVTNGWTVQTYSDAAAEPGDLIIYDQWHQKADGTWYRDNHVNVVEYVDANGVHTSNSSYTGDHGKAYWDKHYDRRTPAVMGNTLQSVSNWMIANYPDRFFCMGTKWYGGTPSKLLKNPGHHEPTPPTPQKSGLPIWAMIPLRKRKKGGRLL